MFILYSTRWLFCFRIWWNHKTKMWNNDFSFFHEETFCVMTAVYFQLNRIDTFSPVETSTVTIEVVSNFNFKSHSSYANIKKYRLKVNRIQSRPLADGLNNSWRSNLMIRQIICLSWRNKIGFEFLRIISTARKCYGKLSNSRECLIDY